MIFNVSEGNNQKSSNPNLIDNPFFNVNSRGITSSSQLPTGYNLYTCDRWFLSDPQNINFSVSDKKINVSASIHGHLAQPIIADKILGKTVTLSVKVNGQIYSNSAVVLSSYPTEKINICGVDLGNRAKCFMRFYPDQTCRICFGDGNGEGGSGEWYVNGIESIKLELGKVSTLEYDIAPDVVEETYKCMISRADSSDTYANKGYASNKNLLDNGWFTVNQRGLTYQTSGRFVDRWRNFGGKQEIVSGGIKFTKNGGTYSLLCQAIESDLKTMLDGKTVTVSIMLSNGTIYSGSNTFSKSSSKTFYSGNGILLDYDKTDIVGFRIYTNLDELTVKAIKLELGTISTLGNDVAPDYATELLKCQRYYYRISAKTNDNNVPLIVGSGYYGSYATIGIDLPVPLVKQPTMNITRDKFTWVCNGQSKSLTDNLDLMISNDMQHITLYDGVSLSEYHTVILKGNSGAVLEFSADL